MHPEDSVTRAEFFRKLNEDASFPAQLRKGYESMLPESFLKQQVVRVK